MNSIKNQKPSDKSEGVAGIGCTDGLGRKTRITIRTVKYLCVVLCVMAVIMVCVIVVCTLLDHISKYAVPILWITLVTLICAGAAYAEECERERKRKD